MYYALELFNRNEISVYNVEDEDFLNMLDDMDFYKDEGKELTQMKDEIIIKNSIFSTHYFLEEEKRQDKINRLLGNKKSKKFNKLLYMVSAFPQRNEK
jgi:hypothetical protein